HCQSRDRGKFSEFSHERPLLSSTRPPPYLTKCGRGLRREVAAERILLDEIRQPPFQHNADRVAPPAWINPVRVPRNCEISFHPPPSMPSPEVGTKSLDTLTSLLQRRRCGRIRDSKRWANPEGRALHDRDAFGF